MKRVLFALVVAAVVFALAYGAAASLTVSGGQVQAGDSSVGQCDVNGVNVSYHVVWDSGQNAFVIDQVTVSGIDAGCNNKTVAVQLTKNNSGVGSSGTATFNSANNNDSVIINISPNRPKAADVDDVHVAIY